MQWTPDLEFINNSESLIILSKGLMGLTEWIGEKMWKTQ